MTRMVRVMVAATVLFGATASTSAQQPRSRRAYSPPVVVVPERYGETTALAAYAPVAVPANAFDVPLPPWGYGPPYAAYPGPFGLGYGYAYGGFGWRTFAPGYFWRGYSPYYPYSYPWAGFGYYPGLLGGYYGPYFGW